MLCVTGECVFRGLKNTAAELPTMDRVGIVLAVQTMAASQADLKQCCILYDGHGTYPFLY